MEIRQQHIVPKGIENIRLSDYAPTIFKDFIPSRKGIKKAIEKGAFRVNGELGKTGTWIKEGQCIELIELDKKVGKVFRLPLTIVYEDTDLALINKPAGIMVNGNSFRTIENALPFNLASSTSLDALMQPKVVHRLDAATNGLLLVAKTRTAQIHLGQQFEQHTIQKTYKAVTVGHLPDEQGLIDRPVDEKTAITRYKVIQKVNSVHRGNLTLVELYPQTGRRHQLRKHLAGLCCPILGDQLYGKEGAVLKGKGLFLSAIGLKFEHPKSGEILEFKIKEPNKFGRLMK